MGKLITIDTDDIEALERILKEMKRKRDIAELEEQEMAYNTVLQRVGMCSKRHTVCGIDYDKHEVYGCGSVGFRSCGTGC